MHRVIFSSFVTRYCDLKMPALLNSVQYNLLSKLVAKGRIKNISNYRNINPLKSIKIVIICTRVVPEVPDSTMKTQQIWKK